MTRGFIGALGAIGFGAVLGALTALSIDPTGNGLWFVGALVGGVASYTLYETRTVWRAVCSIFTIIPKVTNALLSFGKMLCSVEFWKAWAPLAGVYACAFGYTSGIIAIAVAFGPKASFLAFKAIVIPSFCAWVGISVFTASLYMKDSPEHRQKCISKDRGILFAINPFAVVFTWLPKLLVWVVVASVGATTYPFNGLVKIVRLIHNETRILCFLYGSMGATAGYFAGRALESGVWGPLIGAAIGIGLAAIGREIVLKSARTIPVPKD